MYCPICQKRYSYDTESDKFFCATLGCEIEKIYPDYIAQFNSGSVSHIERVNIAMRSFLDDISYEIKTLQKRWTEWIQKQKNL